MAIVWLVATFGGVVLASLALFLDKGTARIRAAITGIVAICVGVGATAAQYRSDRAAVLEPLERRQQIAWRISRHADAALRSPSDGTAWQAIADERGRWLDAVYPVSFVQPPKLHATFPPSAMDVLFTANPSEACQGSQEFLHNDFAGFSTVLGELREGRCTAPAPAECNHYLAKIGARQASIEARMRELGARLTPDRWFLWKFGFDRWPRSTAC